jgi:hypothetical protein
MHNGAKMLLVELIQDLFGVGKDSRIPHERTVLGVPARRTESSAQIDQGIAGQFLIAEGLCLGDHFFPTGKSAMRLLVTKAP